MRYIVDAVQISLAGFVVHKLRDAAHNFQWGRTEKQLAGGAVTNLPFQISTQRLYRSD